MKNPIVKFQCYDCEELYSSKEEADSCCAQNSYEDEVEDGVFYCGTCSEDYNSELEAMECCIHSNKVYLCPECEKTHSTEWFAIVCCLDWYSVSSSLCDPAVLERHGQLRLF